MGEVAKVLGVSEHQIRRFTERFEPYGYKPGAMLPVYGLAENALAVAFPPWGRSPVIDAVKRIELSGSGQRPDGAFGVVVGHLLSTVVGEPAKRLPA